MIPAQRRFDTTKISEADISTVASGRRAISGVTSYKVEKYFRFRYVRWLMRRPLHNHYAHSWCALDHQGFEANRFPLQYEWDSVSDVSVL
ncbi:hypothetical protein FEAC_17690 [Ferrimicrobium acidiphilum DSM 19497]|uniref:Uncharacterized protein n=1 Tax=Ferrimicrobium acidiphilum DSM 19497 TaxID=1121877 RepID=A0A0D8FWA3_9ACTN|nr:hypothetical protein FEAC_17690 [Ferrimicrobium acidiphilum DSM 19497]